MSPPPAPPRRFPWVPVGIVLALVIVGANLAAYLFLRASSPDRLAPEARPDAGPTTVQALAVEQREAGVRELGNGDYERAILRLEAALALDPELADARALLDIARRLQQAEEEDEAEEEDAPEEEDPDRAEPEPDPDREPRRARRTVRPRRRRVAPIRPSPTRLEPAPPEKGNLLVSTEPPGLLIEVDGRPVEISPARVALDPGPHRVRLKRGRRVLHTETVDVEPGGSVTVEQAFPSLLEPEPPEPEPAPSSSSGELAQDGQLDLLDLVDGAPAVGVDDPDVRGAAPATRVESRPPERASGRGLLVVWSRGATDAVAQALRADLGGIDVQVVGSSSGLPARLAEERPAAVMAAPPVLRSAGLEADLMAEGLEPRSPLYAVHFEDAGAKDLASASIGVVDGLGRRRTPVYMARLFDGRVPRFRRVPKVEDLLPLLQFGMVDVVLVRSPELEILKDRTQRTLRALPVREASQRLAVAVLDPARGSAVRAALLDLPEETRTALGIASWTR